jgi:putative membrane protein
MEITQADHDRVAAAIAAAEAHTSGEITVVIAQASAAYSAFSFAWATLGALAAPWPLLVFTELSAHRIYLAQLVVFAILFALLSRPALRLAVTPRRVRRATAHRAAMEQFVLRGVTRTRARTGVLVFCSLAEHYARIVADDGIAETVDKREWQEAVDALIAAAREGRPIDGCVVAVERVGAILARHAPREEGDVNETPDRLYVV